MSALAPAGSVHEHAVAFHDDDDLFVASVASFLSESLYETGAAIAVATAARRGSLEAHLRARGFPLDDLAAAGRFVVLDAGVTLRHLTPQNVPDPPRFEAVVGSLLAEAARVSGGGPVRVFGEVVALLWERGDVGSAIALESLWNDLAERFAFGLYCGYPATVIDDAGSLGSVRRVCDQHSRVVSIPGHRAGKPVQAGTERVARAQWAPSSEVARSFAPTTAAPRAVRALVDDAFAAWGLDADDDAAVIVTELATNAIVHAGSPFHVVLSRVASGIRIAVRDGSDVHPAPRTPRPEALSGRGLLIVDALADTWGTDLEPDGKTVWATLQIPRSA